MSNPMVGSVYQQIIRDVVETSRVDFEEGGVDESVLEELATGWQRKLSSLGVAQFPWDPKPEPAPAPIINNPPPMASNYHQMDTPPMPQSQSAFQLPPLPPMQPMNGNVNEPRIKSEPGVENGLSLPSYNAPSTGLTAPQRAAQNLQATYGARAAASINAIQGNLPQQNQQQTHQQNMQQQRSAGPPIQRPQMSTAQYQQAMAEAAARQRAQLQPTGNAQTDGADEVDGESFGIVKHVDSSGQEIEMGRVEIDIMIRQRIEAMGKRMEGGGLMLPLKKRAPTTQIKKRKDFPAGSSGSNVGLSPVRNDLSFSNAPAQFDGGDEDDDSDDKANVIKDEDLDEDAINSDLDDPDDGLNDDEDDDEAMGHIMLCMYDKVQRVKNKWKCVMKDGVLTVNGKEYVFHKATGEYEW